MRRTMYSFSTYITAFSSVFPKPNAPNPNRLSDDGIVELDEERKAAMVTNLLVVLCADESAQPVVNAGTMHH